MTTEAVKQFWQKAKQDKALQTKLAAIQAKDQKAAITALLKVAGDAGFAFTAQEYEAAIKEALAQQHAAGELKDKEMEAVSGGRLPITLITLPPITIPITIASVRG